MCEFKPADRAAEMMSSSRSAPVHCSCAYAQRRWRHSRTLSTRSNRAGQRAQKEPAARVGCDKVRVERPKS